ncbi:hypothetical protein D3C76_1129610 [compost metagenome]
MAGVEGEHRAHLAFGAGEVAAAQVGLALADHLAQAADALQFAHGVARADVVRLDAQHPFVADLRRGEVALAAVEVGAAQQFLDGPCARGGQRHLQLGVARVVFHRPGQMGQALLVLPRLDQRESLLPLLVGGAAGQQHRADGQRQHSGIRLAETVERNHGALPTASDWD